MNSKIKLKHFILTLVCLFICNVGKSQNFAVKSNMLNNISGIMSLGAEYQLTAKTSLSLMSSYNPWEYADNSKRKYFLLQPEYRRWLREAYDGCFFGLQANYGQFNVGGSLPWWMASFDTFEENRYQGDLFGVGVTSGYQWILSKRFNIEVAASLGYVHCMYDKYDRSVGTPIIASGLHNYWGITHVGFTLVYIIN